MKGASECMEQCDPFDLDCLFCCIEYNDPSRCVRRMGEDDLQEA